MIFSADASATKGGSKTQDFHTAGAQLLDSPSLGTQDPNPAIPVCDAC